MRTERRGEGSSPVDAESWPRSERGSASLTEEELDRWGEVLGRLAVTDGVFVALFGSLGSGKTTVVQAACRGAGTDEPARSPTYVLHHPHRTSDGSGLHHVDLYRLSRPGELDDLAWEELIASGAAVFAEWADRAGERLPEDRWEVRLGFGEEPDRRYVEAARRGGAPPVPDPAAAAEVP